MVCLLSVSLIERLWPYLELQVFHKQEDVVIAFEHMNLLIANGVITLLVVKIHQ